MNFGQRSFSFSFTTEPEKEAKRGSIQAAQKLKDKKRLLERFTKLFLQVKGVSTGRTEAAMITGCGCWYGDITLSSQVLQVIPFQGTEYSTALKRVGIESG